MIAPPSFCGPLSQFAPSLGRGNFLLSTPPAQPYNKRLAAGLFLAAKHLF